MRNFSAQYTISTILFFYFSGLIGCTRSQENLPSADEVLKKVSSVVGDIPELNNPQLNASLPNIEEAKTLFKDKCTKNGGPNAFDNVQRAQEDMMQCIRSLVNFTELQAEMERYKPTGDLDIVFKNYCNKRSTLKACVSNFTDTIEHCLDKKERENKKVVLNITDSLLEFICYKEGDRIARTYETSFSRTIPRDLLQIHLQKFFSETLHHCHVNSSLNSLYLCSLYIGWRTGVLSIKTASTSRLCQQYVWRLPTKN